MRRILCGAVALLFILSSGLSAYADLFTWGVNLGAAGRTKEWAVFSLGGGVTDTDVTGTADIYGDVGVAGNGDINLTGNGVIHGDLYYHTPGTLKKKGASTITGSTYNGATYDTLLNQGVTDANNASDQAYAFAPTQPSITKIDNTMTISGSGRVVLKISDFSLNGKDILTLQGTSPNTVFIINVSNHFDMNDQSKIVLSGLMPSDVLFNVRNATNTTGPDLHIQKQASFQGILLATKRTVQIKDAAIARGEIIANRIDISGTAQIIHPPVTSM